MRIYLHIGIHKTGTTAVQLAFMKDAALLAEHGVLYPLSGRPDDPSGLGHRRLAWKLLGARMPSDPWQQLRHELSVAPEQMAVLSSEVFDVLDRDDQFARIRAELKGHDVKVIVYLRRQDEVLHAMYCTDVLHYGEDRPFDVYRDSFPTELDYRVLLSRWEACLGRENLLVRVYERKRLVGGDMVSDFLDCIGLSGSIPLRAPDHQMTNKSFPRNVIELVLALRHAGVAEEGIRDVVGLAGAVYTGRTDSDMLSPDERREVMAHYRESNAHVARTYLNRADGHLFDDTECGDESEWQARYQAPHADLMATVADARRRFELADRAS